MQGNLPIQAANQVAKCKGFCIDKGGKGCYNRYSQVITLT